MCERDDTFVESFLKIDLRNCDSDRRPKSIRFILNDLIFASETVGLLPCRKMYTRRRTTFLTWGVTKGMDYLLVIFTLASMGAAFAGAKFAKRGKKHLTRLEL